MRFSIINSLAVLGPLTLATFAYGQAPAGPIAPQPGVTVQLAATASTIKLRSILVNTPVTVRDASGEMVHTLEAKDFRITDNGVQQTIMHFDLGGDPISLVIVVETSSRIDPLMPQIRKTGILLTQAVAGPTGETAIVGFNDSVDKLLDFTSNADAVERTMSRLHEGTSGAKLYDAMALGVENRWAQAFAGIVKDPPSWYVPATGYAAFNPIFFSGAMHSMANDMHQVFVSAPRASSTGSGFGGGGGGGGFSGGGFGGGGGSAF